MKPISIDTSLEVLPQKKQAGGMPAITSSMKHILAQMDLARGTKTLLRMNQAGGFDCPGCAWPEPDGDRSFTEFCENGAKAIAEEATLKRVGPDFFANNSIDDLLQESDFYLSQLGRLTHPMVKHPGRLFYQPIAWSDAYYLIAEHLKALVSPHEATFYTSGRTSNEAAFLYQLFVRLFGTNNLPDCSNMCHESSGVALHESIGIGKGTVKLADFDHADCILVIGQNPGTNHPRMLTALQRAARNGANIVSINPLKEAGIDHFKHPQEMWDWVGKGTPLACLWIQPRINGDLALLKGLMKELLSLEDKLPGSVFDHDFIDQHTAGFDELTKDLRQTPWELIENVSSVSHDQISQLANLVAKSKQMIVCWAMGLTQHKNGVATIQQAVNLLLLGGHLGRVGAGVCPVRGHSNVQGDRTMGIGEKMPDWFLDKLGQEFQFSPTREHGLDTVESLKAMHEKKVKVFFAMGGNFFSATPDTTYVAQALANCALTVQVSTKLNRGHLVTGQTALILPCLGRTEIDMQKSGPQFVTVENSMGVVQASIGKLKPASGDLKSEVAIVSGLAQAVLGDAVTWQGFVDDYDSIRLRISRVIPGFYNYTERAKQPGGFYLPNPVRDSLKFPTHNQKANFKTHPIEKWDLPEGFYWLMTIRSHDQFNTTIYGMEDRYRGIKGGRRVLFMNPQDMMQADFQAGTKVDVVSHFQDQSRSAHQFSIVPYDIPSRCLAAYFPETNVLVSIENTADRSNTPVYKSVVVSLHACAPNL